MMRRPVQAALAAMALGAALPASADEYTTFQSLLVTSTSASGHPGCSSVAMLNLPAGWAVGDAAVVLMTRQPIADGLRDPLVAALLDEHAAVLELVSAPSQRCAPDGAEDSGATAAVDPVGDAFGALRAVTRDAGAGMAVAIGYGPGAAAVLESLREDLATRHLGVGGPRFSAGAALRDGSPHFVLGPAQMAGQQAPARLGLLCEAIAQAVGGLDPGQRAANGAMAEDCRVSLRGASPLPERTPTRR